MAVVAPCSLRPLVPSGADRAALDRRVRATDRLTVEAAKHKVRIKDLVRQLLPMSPLRGDLTRADLAVLERFADPKTLVHAGCSRLCRVTARASNNHLGAARAGEWLSAARSSLELYGRHPAVAFFELAAEVQSEVRLSRPSRSSSPAPKPPKRAPTIASTRPSWSAPFRA